MMVEKQRKTFLSYSRINKNFAIQLAKELKSEGFDIWLDQLDIPAGSRWDREVEKALRESEIFMIILTPASVDSENVLDEIGYAIDNGKSFLPVLLENCTVPLRLRRFQYVDFTNKSFDEGVEGAKGLLRGLVAQSTIPRPEFTGTQFQAKADRLAAQKSEEDRLVKRKAVEKAIPDKTKVQTVPVVSAQKKLASKGLMIGFAAVVLFAIVSVLLSALLNGWIRNTPDATQTTATAWPLADDDKDGLNNGEEIQKGTDPLKADTDGDGLKDGQEVSIGLNPLKPDTYRDGTPDVQDTAALNTPTSIPTPTVEPSPTLIPPTQTQPPTPSQEDIWAARGAVLASEDPLAIELRSRQTDSEGRRGFDIGMAVAENDTSPGPGKDRIGAALPLAEQSGFATAVTFSVERNKYKDYAAVGAYIAQVDPIVASARTANSSVFFWLGFDIAAGLYGDPALGALGYTAEGPGSNAIRDSLDPNGQAGFRAAVNLFLVDKH